MNDKHYTIGLLIQMICVLALALALSDSKSKSDRLRNEAIERGFAEHNRVTGEWQWVEPATQP